MTMPFLPVKDFEKNLKIQKAVILSWGQRVLAPDTLWTTSESSSIGSDKNLLWRRIW